MIILSLTLTAASIGLCIFLCIWVSKDAKNRGVDNPTLWVLVVLFAGWIGLIIYLVTRPPGELVKCPECGEKKLRKKRCPHCRY